MAEREFRPTHRVRDHVDRLRQAGFDTQRFFDALAQIRDDTLLPKEHREALYQLIATESFVWYIEALRNEPVDRAKLAEEALKLAKEHEVAIRKSLPGEQAAQLAQADVGGAPKEGADPNTAPKPAPPAAPAKSAPAAAPRPVAGPLKPKPPPKKG